MTYEEKQMVRLNVSMRLAGLFVDMREKCKPHIVRDVIRAVKTKRGTIDE